MYQTESYETISHFELEMVIVDGSMIIISLLSYWALIKVLSSIYLPI